MSNMDTILKNPNYEELRNIYTKYFSLRNMGADINNKFGLLSLVGFLTDKARQKNPDASCYQVLMKVTNGRNFPDEYLKGLSIVCEDFMYNVKSFNTCGCKSAQEMIAQINNILDNWLPF